MTSPTDAVPPLSPVGGGTAPSPTPPAPLPRTTRGVRPSARAAVLRHRVLHLTGLVARLLLTVLGLLTLLFFLVRLSGDPAAVIAGASATSEQLDAIRAELGLDEPLLTQYAAFLADTARLDFGTSIFSGRDALGTALEKLPATLQLTAATLVVSLLLGIPAGVALTRGARLVRRLLDAVLTLCQAVPPFVLGVLLIWWFAVQAGLLPAFGSGTAESLVLPTATLAAFTIARIARMLAAELEHGAGQDHLRTALAKGASPRRVLWRHALPNAFPPVAAMLVVEVSYLLSGAVVVEVLFAYNGIGKQLVDAVFARDYPIVQATVFVIGMLVVVVNVLGELVLARLDPRTTREAS